MAELTELETEPDLLKELRRGVAKGRTANEVFEQRVSFVFGSMNSESNVTREQVRKVLVRDAVAGNDPIRNHAE